MKVKGWRQGRGPCHTRPCQAHHDYVLMVDDHFRVATSGAPQSHGTCQRWRLTLEPS